MRICSLSLNCHHFEAGEALPKTLHIFQALHRLLCLSKFLFEYYQKYFYKIFYFLNMYSFFVALIIIFTPFFLRDDLVKGLCNVSLALPFPSFKHYLLQWIMLRISYFLAIHAPLPFTELY